MRTTFNLAELLWTVEGYTPYVWLFERMYNSLGEGFRCIDIKPVPAQVPGSVQAALREAGFLPDWNIGVNYRQCEWVEHRHWMYRAHIPDEWLNTQGTYTLECLGLDYAGWVLLNGEQVAEFKGTHIPHSFSLDRHLKDSANILEIVFDQPPRWLGQFGYTSRMREWKPRFNYTWDWSPRLVQVGIWDDIKLHCEHGAVIRDFACTTSLDLDSGTGVLECRGSLTTVEDAQVEVLLSQGDTVVWQGVYAPEVLIQGLRIDRLPVDAWWSNLEGDHPVYKLQCRLIALDGTLHDRVTRQVGFKHVAWKPCEGAPDEADPWVCEINGRPVFLQGVNFAPLSPLFADLTREEYAARLLQYQQLGANLLRINACQFLEKEWFYEICDQLGLMVWQDFPLTSSGIDNWPPEDEHSIEAMAEVAASFVRRRRHHVSLLLWSGGNELQGDFEGTKSGIGKPCDLDHPMLKRLHEVVSDLDPQHRYVPTSPSGPRAGAEMRDFGKGLHWDVHGGAAMMGSLEKAQEYWENDDALFRSELYCPGASPISTIRKYAGDFDTFPPTHENPYWTRLTSWWIDLPRLVAVYEREPRDLEEYVEWSQAQQAERLALEMKSCKDRFPRCGGILLWSGHDTFPLAINSTLIDYDGNLKPSAHAVSRVWRGEAD